MGVRGPDPQPQPSAHSWDPTYNFQHPRSVVVPGKLQRISSRTRHEYQDPGTFKSPLWNGLEQCTRAAPHLWNGLEQCTRAAPAPAIPNHRLELLFSVCRVNPQMRNPGTQRAHCTSTEKTVYNRACAASTRRSRVNGILKLTTIKKPHKSHFKNLNSLK